MTHNNKPMLHVSEGNHSIFSQVNLSVVYRSTAGADKTEQFMQVIVICIIKSYNFTHNQSANTLFSNMDASAPKAGMAESSLEVGNNKT